MSYLVLARKFRPQTFRSIVGQEHITRALANAILWDRVPHALLFTGPRGVGKTTSARVFARALNCTGREVVKGGDSSTGSEQAPSASSGQEVSIDKVEPCGECQNCKEIARSSSIAVREIDGASNNSVENVRDLIDSLRSLPPPGSAYKIYIIDEVHMLSTAAFNALLKSLEEPPPNTVFIFATTEPHKIPETVISRCQRHDFRRMSVDTIRDSLAEVASSLGVKGDEEVFEFLAIKARGGMRDAQTMLDRLISFSGNDLNLDRAQQLFGVVDSSYFFRLSGAVLAQDPQACFELLDEAFQQSLDIRSFVADFVTHWRNLFLLSTMKGGARGAEKKISRILEVTKRDFAELAKQVESSESFDMQRLFEIAEGAGQSAITSNFPRFVLEAAVAKMALLPSLRPLGEILAGLEGGSPLPVTSSSSAASAPKQAAPKQASSAAAAAAGSSVLTTAGFNPSWQNFIAYVRGARSEQRLAAHLSRVSPQVFGEGKLTVEGGDFDIDALKDSQTSAALKGCLEGYSGQEGWELRFLVVQPKKEERRRDAEPSSLTSSIEKKRVSNAVPGSLVALEEEASRQRRSQIDGEARNDPMVKAALSMFEGSTIERVSVLKEEK